MKLTVLADNRTKDERLKTEHGLSLLLETNGKRILLDTGASDLFMRNAEKMNIDLRNVDYVFVSHGHRDHAGGLSTFLACNEKAKVIVAAEAVKGMYFSMRDGQHSITTKWPFEMMGKRTIMVEKSGELERDIYVIANILHGNAMPAGNNKLYVQKDDGKMVLDDFTHEIVLYVDGLLFTGCAHNGVLNIMESCPFPVHTVVGGFHLLDEKQPGEYETEEEVREIAKSLIEKYPDTKFYTGHCTGDGVMKVMREVMGESLQPFYCGLTVEMG